MLQNLTSFFDNATVLLHEATIQWLHDMKENKCRTFHGAIDLKGICQRYLSDQYAENVNNSKDPSEDATSSPLQYHSATAVQV